MSMPRVIRGVWALGIATFSCISLMGQSAPPAFNFGLANLPFLTDAQTRSVSAENPTREKGRGGMAIPNTADPRLPFSKAASDLGQGWKVNPFLKPKAHETVTLMDVNGPGVIQHIWMATETDWRGNGRASILR